MGPIHDAAARGDVDKVLRLLYEDPWVVDELAYDKTILPCTMLRPVTTATTTGAGVMQISLVPRRRWLLAYWNTGPGSTQGMIMAGQPCMLLVQPGLST